MALELGIAPEKHRAAIALDLVADIRKRGWHLSTGFSGTQMLLPALSEAGYHDVACRLLLNRDYPSWGYTIKKGATTIWELWNSDTEGPSMNSRNHFAFGSVGEWLFRYLAGIDLAPNSTGYKHVLIHPHPSRPAGELRWVKAAYDSIQGRIASEWKVEPSAFTLSVEIPANTKATVVIPADTVAKVTESGNPLRQAAVVTKVRTAKGNVICEIGAGRYDFRSESRLFKV
jgi:alpha-L-rhamnosidase